MVQLYHGTFLCWYQLNFLKLYQYCSSLAPKHNLMVHRGTAVPTEETASLNLRYLVSMQNRLPVWFMVNISE